MGFLEVNKQLKQCCIVLQFFLKHLMNAEYRSVVDQLLRNPYWWSPVVPSAYGVNFGSRMLHKMLYVYSSIITIVCFITVLINRYSDRNFPLLRQLLLIPSGINKFKDLKVNYPVPYFNHFYWDLISTWWFVSPLASQWLSQTEKRWVRAPVALLCKYFYLPNIFNPMYIQ